MSALESLRERCVEFWALAKVGDLLEWDLEVAMPRGGGTQARALQLGAVGRAAHERFTAPEVGRWIEAAAVEARGSEDGEALVRWAQREWRRRSRQPAALVEELARHTALASEVWAEARRKGDFAAFRPALERMVELKKRQAAALGDFPDPYDAWLEEFEPGMPTARVDALFAELKAGLVPLVKEVLAKGEPRAPELRGPFDLERQKTLGLEVARAMGFDFARGRLDVSAHPFSTSSSPDDVRLTTRYSLDAPFGALFGVMHEAGHGLYEQNVDAAFGHTPLARGATMAVHESQSRLWENLVGRSREFWRRWAPRFVELFPQAKPLGPEGLYRAANVVAPTHIRVEADELTYSLHILLRFELERELLSGKTRVKDLPEAWAAKSKAYLGIVPPNDALGVLQDVHWASGLIGYFPTYAVGNMISVQLWDAALEIRPSIPAEVERGDCAPLLSWLVENVHRHGRKFSAEELVRRACGAPISAAPYLRYLRAKFGAAL